MRTLKTTIKRGLMIAILVSIAAVQLCVAAEEHTCPDFNEHEKTLQQGNDTLFHLTPNQGFGGLDPTHDSGYGALINYPPMYKKTPRKLSKEEIDKLTAFKVESDEDAKAAYSISRVLMVHHAFKESNDIWDKVLAFWSSRDDEESLQTAMAKVYLARTEVLLGAYELNSDVRERVQTSGFLRYTDVTPKTSQKDDYCTGDRKKLNQHWNEARNLYLQALKYLEKDKTRELMVVQSVRLQLACLDEWSGKYDQAFYRAFDLFQHPTIYAHGLTLPPPDEDYNFINFYGQQFERPGEFVADFVTDHKDWHKAEMLSNVILKTSNGLEFASERRLLGSLIDAYCSNQRSPEAWLIVDKLIAWGDDTVVSGSLPSLIKYAGFSDRANLLALLQKVPATLRDAKALEAKAWFPQAEERFIALTKDNQNSEMYQFELAEFYQRRNRWRDAAAVYNSMVDRIAIDCKSDMDSATGCRTLLNGLAKGSLSESNEASADYAGLRKKIEQTLSLCNMRISKSECLQLSQELYTTAFSLEKGGDVAQAKKLYASSLEIKENNLPEYDLSKVAVMVDLARLEAQEGNVLQAKAKFERAITICQRAPKVPEESYLYALENYGDFLSKTKQEKRADEIYELARKIRR